MDWGAIPEFFNWLVGQKDLLETLGYVAALGTPALGILIKFWPQIKRLLPRRHRKPVEAADRFPFEVIPPGSPMVVRRLLDEVGADLLRDDPRPLADYKIPYQAERVVGRNTRRELEEALRGKRWLAILGRSGLGKTREAAELAALYFW